MLFVCINTLQELCDANAKCSQLLQNCQAIVLSHVSSVHKVGSNWTSVWAASMRKLVHVLLYCMQGQVLKTGRPLAPLPAILQKSSRGIGVRADWLDSIQQTYSLYLACIKPKSPQAVPGKLSWQVQCLICCCSCQLLVHSHLCWTPNTLCFSMMQSQGLLMVAMSSNMSTHRMQT